MHMNLRIAEIIIWDEKAFVPSNAYYRNGIFTNIEPIYMVAPSLSELLPIAQLVLDTEPVLLPDPTKEEVKVQQDVFVK
jgi:hypothetical protein